MRRRSGAAARAARLLAVAALVALVGGAPSATGTALAQGSGQGTTGGEPTGAGTDDPAGAGVRLVDQSEWVGPQGSFQVLVRLDGLPAGSQVGYRLHSRVSGRERFSQSIEGDNLGSVLLSRAPRPAAELTPAGDGTIVLTVPVSATYPAPDDGVVLANPGVYPFVIDVVGADDQELDQVVTHLVRLPPAGTGTTPLAVGVVLPLDAAASVALDGSPFLDQPEATGLTEAITTVTAVPPVPLTLAPTPESLQLLATRDEQGGATVAALASALTGRQVLASPYAPLDLGAWQADGLDGELSEQYDAGRRTTATLVGAQPDATAAILDRSVTPDALGGLRRRGVDKVVVPSGQLDPLAQAGNVTFTQLFDVETPADGPVRAAVADQLAADRLTTTDDPVLNGHLALADLAVLHLDDPSQARGIAVVPTADADPEAVRTMLGGLADPDGDGATGSSGGADAGTTGTAAAQAPGAAARMVAPVTLDGLFAVTDTAQVGRNRTLVRTYASDPPPSLGGYPDDLRDSRRTFDGLRSMVPDAPELTDAPARAILASGSRRLQPGDREAMLGYADGRAAAAATEIVVPPEQVVTLTSRSGKVPLNLENRLPVPATVRIVLSSAKLDFPDGGVIEQALAPATTTRIDIEVTTRASGAFPLDVSIRSGDGTLEVAATRYTVRSTAISGFGLVLSIGAGLFLAVWWARHFRTARRARKLVASNHPALSADEPDGYAPPDTDPLEGR